MRIGYLEVQWPQKVLFTGYNPTASPQLSFMWDDPAMAKLKTKVISSNGGQ